MTQQLLLSDDEMNRAVANARSVVSIQAAANAASETDPPRARSDANLAARSGVPFPQGDPLGRTLAQVRATQNLVAETAARAPGLVPYLVDPRTFGRIGDDLQSFGDIAAAVQRHRPPVSLHALLSGIATPPRDIYANPFGSAPTGLMGTAAAPIINAGLAMEQSFVGGAIEMGGRVLQGAPRALQGFGIPGWLGLAAIDYLGDGPGSTAHAARATYAPVAHYGQNFSPPTNSPLVNRLQTAAFSAGGSAVSLLASAATRNPMTGVAVAGLSQEERAYETAINAGLDPATAQSYADIDGLVEGGLEYLSNRFFVGDVSAGSGFLTTLKHQILSEVPSELATTALQDLNRYAYIDSPHGQSFGDFAASVPGDLVDTLITTVLATGMTTGVAHPIAHVIDQHLQGVRAAAAAETVDRIMDAAAQSATRRESPEDFHHIVAGLSEGTPVENLYIPAENVRQLFQSPDDLSEHPFWSGYEHQINEAEALGGDVVIPLSEAATHLAGTPEWAALKDHVRTSPGGMSAAEARDMEGHFEETVRRTAADLTSQIEAEHAVMEPVRQVYEAMREKLQAAGFRPDAASHLAEQFAQRQATRAQRLGRELTGQEADAIDVRQVLPERLASVIQAAEVPDAGLRAVIAEMQRKRSLRSDRARLGPSLLEFIASRGGIEDVEGDLAAIGFAPKKGKAKKGARKLIRPTTEAGMFGAAGNQNKPDALAHAAWEAGYFPNMPERPTVSDLYEAMRTEHLGTPVYAVENDRTDEGDHLRMAAQELHDILDQQGVDPETATHAEIAKAVSRYQSERASGRGFDQSLFDEPAQPERTMTQAQRAELEARQLQSKARRGGQVGLGDQAGGLFSNERAQDSLFQSYGDGPRGRITFTPDGKSVIDLFEARDLSTFLHEIGHHYLEELKADAALSLHMDTPEGRGLFADYEAVKAWFKSEGHAIGPDGQIPTEAHELFARGFERYAMEGKAPSSALRRAFEAFRSWLITIYKNASRLKAPITPEIREVMNRMMATDEEIAAAAEAQNLKALFTSAEQAGMTEQEFAAYKASTEEARGDAHTALLKRVMANVRSARTKEWREQEANVRGEVMAATDAQPLFRALRLLRTGKLGDEDARSVKLDKAALIASYGPEVLNELPKSVPPIYAEANTMHADDIAEQTGFRSGDEMIRTLIGHEQTRQDLRAKGDKRSPRQVLIDEGTAQKMAELHGDPLRDGSIEDEARALIHNDAQGEIIAAEIRALARQTNKRPTPYSLAKQWAAEKIARGKVSEVASGAALQQYERAARRAGKAAEEAILKGDADETFRQKQSQMLNNALIAEAKKAKDRVDVAVRRLSRLARRKTMASIDQGYLDQIHGLLEQVELRQRSQASIDRQESFETWAKAQDDAGHDIVVPPSFAASLGSTHWSRLSVEALTGLDDTVQQILHLGRLKQTLLDGIERRNFDEIVGEAEAAAAKLPPRPPSDLMEPAFGDRLKGKVAAFDSALLKIETLVDWLDSKNSGGVFNRIVFKPIAEAQTRAADMFAEYTGKLNEALAQVSKKTLRRWGDRVTVPELLNRETGNPFVFTRHQLISMALNMGNEQNAQRLADGYGWNENGIMAALNRELTPEEWTYVQNVWDTIGGLWPHIEAMEKNINGVAPEKVPARPLETAHGTLPGGYFPAVYDSTRDYQAEKNAARESDLFEARYTRATTRASATKERADIVKRPILLNLGVITRHVGEVVHDITHREAIMNADKFLSSKRVMKAIDNSLGPQMRQQFRPWLKFVANQWAAERAGNEGIGKFIDKMRANATVVGLGFRFSTMMLQLGGYANSFEVVGAKWVSQAVAQTSVHPIETFKFVMERSGEVRHRMDTLDRDIDQAITRMAGRTNPLTAAQRFAYHGIGYMDRVVVIPTWVGAYNRAISEGQEESAAVYAADKAVRQSQGAGSAKDLAAVARGTGKYGGLMKMLTMFYSYMSAVYQRQRTLGRDVRSASLKDLPGLMARAWWLVVVPPILSELMAGRGPGDDEDWGWWSVKNMLFQALGAIPIARDVARPVWDGVAGDRPFDYQLSPMQRAGQSLVNVAADVGRIREGEETRHATRDTLEAAGYWTGLVPGQAAASTQFLVDVGNGDQDPESAYDWYKGLTTGHVPAE